MNRDELIKKYLNKEATSEELLSLLKSIEHDNVEEMDEAIQLHWQKIMTDTELKPFDLQKISQKVMDRIVADQTQTSSKQRWLSRKSYFVAASILIGLTIGLTLYFYNQNQSANQLAWKMYNTGKGERKVMTLEDGTKVTINANSTLKYPKQFNPYERMVELSGEAYFEVVRDTQKPFLVKTKNTTTMVLGTQFNVDAYPEDSLEQISLVEGSVEVSFQDKLKTTKEYKLKPNEQLSLTKYQHIGQIDTFKLWQVIGWKDNIFVFERMSLLEVSLELSRHFGVRFHFQNAKLKDCLTHGRIKSDSLNKILDYLSGLSNIKYEVKGKEVYISGQGC